MTERKILDWEAAKRRLERSRAVTDRTFQADPKRVQTMLRQRAERLARPLEAQLSVSEDVQVLIFSMGAERYALELSHIAEVIPDPFCAPVPGGPPQLAGVVQVRGEIRPVLELSRILGLPDLPAGEPDCVLLLRRDSRELGVRTGRVEGIRALAPAERGEAPGNPAHVKWITPDLIAVLDPDDFFSEEFL